jgi:hypothetical protein
MAHFAPDAAQRSSTSAAIPMSHLVPYHSILVPVPVERASRAGHLHQAGIIVLIHVNTAEISVYVFIIGIKRTTVAIIHDVHLISKFA